MPYKPARLKRFQPTGAIPRTLIVGVKHVAQPVGAHATGRTQSAGSGNHLAIRRHPQGPAPKQAFAVEGTGQTQHDPNVPVPIRLRTKGVFVVITVDAPTVGHGLNQVGAVIAIRVFQPGDFAALGGVNPSVPPGPQAQDFMQSGRKPGELHLARIPPGAVHQIDVPQAGGHREALTRQNLDRARFQHDSLRDGKGHQRIVLRLPVRLR